MRRIRTRTSRRAAAALGTLALAAGLVAGACAPPPATGGFEVGRCYSAGGILGDLRFNGPEDSARNADLYNTGDGSCTGSSVPVTVVRAATSGDAALRCDQLLGESPLRNPVDLGLYAGTPADGWGC